jgi:precorrin-3B synthase
MSAVAIKGWCPGAWRPMASGDGLLVRIRTPGGRIDAAQAAGIADLAGRYGNGLIDLTSRANLQIRGVCEAGYPALIERLAQLGLLDSDPDAEVRRNLLVTPFWKAGDEASLIAQELERALAAGPVGLPAKFGFAVDCGSERVLADASADIRIERGDAGELIVRADGAEFGRPVARIEAVKAAIDLAEWFMSSGGLKAGRGRMAAHIAEGARPPESLCGEVKPARNSFVPKPGLTPYGALVGAAFGQMTHATLKWLAGKARGLRLTPWRMLLAEGLHEMPQHEGLVTRADDPRLRVISCSGAPRCREAHADTRALAAALAPHLTAGARLHVSGCIKGCAHPKAAPLTLVATAEGFNLVRDGSARDAPFRRGLRGDQLIQDPAILGSG